MLTKEQYLYQAKLIIDCFPKEEYEQIPQGILEYIEENMKEDPNIVINPNVSLEEQDIDPQTLKLLKNIINIVDENNFYEEYKKELAKIRQTYYTLDQTNNRYRKEGRV